MANIDATTFGTYRETVTTHRANTTTLRPSEYVTARWSFCGAEATDSTMAGLVDLYTRSGVSALPNVVSLTIATRLVCWPSNGRTMLPLCRSMIDTTDPTTLDPLSTPCCRASS